MPFPPFSDEHTQLRRTVREFCERELAPHAEEWDKEGSFPRSIFKDLAGLGLLGIRYPEDLGGLGLDWWYSVAFMEELVHARSGGVTMSILVDTDMATPVIHKIGTKAQQEEFLGPVISGDKVACLGVTEPGCGSDVAALRTIAKKDGGDYLITGQKTFITNGAFADFVVLVCRTGDEGYGGISLILVPTDAKGFSVGRKLDKLGTRAVDSCEIHFDEVRVPREYLLGDENMGFYYLMNNFQGERIAGSIMAYSGALWNLREAVRYGEQREAFGRPVMKFQWWRHKFAEHLAKLEAARQLTYAAVQKEIDGDNPTREVSMAKLFAGELAQEVVNDCLQLHGGYGYIEEYPVCRAFRDTRLITIGGGTSEVMREIIAKWEGW